MAQRGSWFSIERRSSEIGTRVGAEYRCGYPLGGGFFFSVAFELYYHDVINQHLRSAHFHRRKRKIRVLCDKNPLGECSHNLDRNGRNDSVHYSTKIPKAKFQYFHVVIRLRANRHSQGRAELKIENSLAAQRSLPRFSSNSTYYPGKA